MTLNLNADIRYAADDLYISKIIMLTPEKEELVISWDSCGRTWENKNDKTTFKGRYRNLMINGEPADGKINLIRNAMIDQIKFHSNIEDVTKFHIDVTQMEFKDEHSSYNIEGECLYHYPDI